MGIVAAYAVPHPPIIVPQVGCGREEAIRSTIDAYREVARRIAAHAPDAVIVVSPHAPFLRDRFFISDAEVERGDMARFGAPAAALEIPCDAALAQAIASAANLRGLAVCGGGVRVGQLDHGAFVPLSFLDGCRGGCRLVRMGLSLLSPYDHREMGRCLRGEVERLGRRAVVVASGDLSHKLREDGPYGFAPEGPAFDRAVTELLDAGDFEGLFGFDGPFCEAAAECGLRSFQIMAGALEELSHDSALLSYEGPFGVGYAVAAFEVRAEGANGIGGFEAAAADLRCAAKDEAASDKAAVEGADPLVALARAAVEGFVRTGRPPRRPSDLPSELTQVRAGAFVSLHEKGGLRGCIGTIEPACDDLADEIMRCAVLAASEDPRFPPVRPEELDLLSYSVDVLSPAEEVESPDELDPKRYGVIVAKGWRRGLLLPDLEGVDAVEDQLAIAKRKAGIDPADGEVRLARFEVARHARGGEARRG